MISKSKQKLRSNQGSKIVKIYAGIQTSFIFVILFKLTELVRFSEVPFTFFSECYVYSCQTKRQILSILYTLQSVAGNLVHP